MTPDYVMLALIGSLLGGIVAIRIAFLRVVHESKRGETEAAPKAMAARNGT